MMRVKYIFDPISGVAWIALMILVNLKADFACQESQFVLKEVKYRLVLC